MRFASVAVLFSSLGVVFANPLVEKRAATSDRATIGYATLSGGTTGGGSATPVTVATLEALKTALTGNAAKVILVSGAITGDEVIQVPANTTILGKSGATLTGVGLRVINVTNVIIRNLKINQVLATAGDHIGIQAANHVWIDHVDLWSDYDHDKDHYDGLFDVTHGSYAVTITNSYLHDHWKASLAGHSSSNGVEDKALQVTYAFNKWYNLNSRTPSFRFGHGHVFNNYFLSNNDGISSRDGAELLIQNNVFEDVSKPCYTDGGTIIASGNIGGCEPLGIIRPLEYSYAPGDAASVKASVNANAGATLLF